VVKNSKVTLKTENMFKIKKTQSGGGVKRRQKGKGFITDLLKTGAKQALRAAAQTGLDVLDNKRSLKEAIKTHGIRAIKSTAQPLLARGGPKKRPQTRGGPKQRPQTKRGRKTPPPIKRAPIKRPPMNRAAIKRAPMNKKPAIKRSTIKRPKRVLDIFD
jgi:hypothetical protein